MEGRHEATQVPWLHTSLRVIGVLSDLEVTVWADPTGAMFYEMNPTSAANLIEAASKEQKPTQCWGSSC